MTNSIKIIKRYKYVLYILRRVAECRLCSSIRGVSLLVLGGKQDLKAYLDVLQRSYFYDATLEIYFPFTFFRASRAFLAHSSRYSRTSINTRVLNIRRVRSILNLLTFATLAKESASVPLVVRHESFLRFFFWHQDGIARGGIRSSCSARSGGIRSLSGCGWSVSNQSAASGTIRATWAGRENRTFLSFPVRARTYVKNVRVPVGDASLLIDGDASKTFTIVRRSRGKESERGIVGGTGPARRLPVARSRAAFTYENDR